MSCRLPPPLSPAPTVPPRVHVPPQPQIVYREENSINAVTGANRSRGVHTTRARRCRIEREHASPLPLPFKIFDGGASQSTLDILYTRGAAQTLSRAPRRAVYGSAPGDDTRSNLISYHFQFRRLEIIPTSPPITTALSFDDDNLYNFQIGMLPLKGDFHLSTYNNNYNAYTYTKFYIDLLRGFTSSRKINK